MEKILGEKGRFIGTISSDTKFITKLIRIAATTSKPVTINPRMARNLPHFAAFKRKLIDSGVN